MIDLREPGRVDRLPDRPRVLGQAIDVVEIEDGGLRHVTHAYFGSLDLTRGMRLAAVHIEHHTRQLATVR